MKKQIYKLGLLAVLTAVISINANAQGACFQLGGNENDAIFDIHTPNANSFIIAGNTNSFGNGKNDIYVAAYTQSGNQIWSQAIGTGNDDHYSNSILTTDNHLVVVGTKTSFRDERPLFEIVVYKIHSSGTVLWNRTIKAPSPINLISGDIKETATGDFLVVGNSGPNSTEETYLATLDGLTGVLMNSATLDFQVGGPVLDILEDHVVQKMTNTSDGGTAIIAANLTNGGFYLYKIGAGVNNFMKRLTMTFTGGGSSISGHHTPRDVIEMPNGDLVIVGGHSDENNSFSNGFIIRTNSAGTPLGWRALVGSTSMTSSTGNILESVALSPDATNLVIGGQIDNHKYLGKIDNVQGIPLTNSKIYGMPESILYGVVTGPNGNVVATGKDPNAEGLSNLMGENGCVMNTSSDLSNCCEVDDRGTLRVDGLNSETILFTIDQLEVDSSVDFDSVSGGEEQVVCQPFRASVAPNQFEKVKGELKLYPTQVSQLLNVEISEEYLETNYRIVDSSGKVILSGRLVSKLTSIDVAILPAGIFVIHIQKDGVSEIEKFVKIN